MYATKKVDENWTKYVLKILEHGGIEINESEGINELAMLKAIQVMDKSLEMPQSQMPLSQYMRYVQVYIRVCICNTLCMVLVLSCLSLFESCSPTLIMYVGCMALLMTYAMILYCRV